MIGTMNNAGTVLLTIADMSVIEAEIEVDETDIPTVQIGQKAKVTIDAIPDRTFTGHGDRDRQQPDSDGRERPARAGDELQGRGDARRPDSRGAARLHVHGRHHDRHAHQAVVSVPIQALTVRELIYDAAGKIVREPQTTRRRRASSAPASPRRPSSRPGQTQKEVEGVFVVRPARPTRSSSCRSRRASPATSTSRCSRASRSATGWSPGRSRSVRELGDEVTGRRSRGSATKK